MKPNAPLPEWTDVKDLRHLYGIREAFAYKWIRSKKIKTVLVKMKPTAKHGKRLVELDSVRKLLASSIHNSPAQAGPGCKGRKQQVAA